MRRSSVAEPHPRVGPEGKSRFGPGTQAMSSACRYTGPDMSKLEPSGARADVLIGGGGFTGLALAVALRQSLGERFSVTVADPALASAASRDPRTSAIAAG